MKLRLSIVVALIALLPAACATKPQTAEGTPERAVEQTFLGYKTALLEEDGGAASDLVTAGSLEYYRDMADESLTANRARLMDMHVVDRITILLFRQGLTTEQLRRMSGKELMAFAVERGWFSENSVATAELTNYRTEGAFAEANLLRRDGSASSIGMEFRREDDAWRLDLLHNLDVARKSMRLALALSGMSEEELLRKSLESSTGEKVTPAIWDPPL